MKSPARWIPLLIVLAGSSAARGGGLEPPTSAGIEPPEGGIKSSPPGVGVAPSAPGAPAAGGLDLESAAVPPEAVQAVRPAVTDSSGRWAIVMLLAMGALVGGAIFAGRRTSGSSSSPVWNLRTVPFSAKLALTMMLLVYGLTHAVAAVTVYLDTRVVYESTTEYFKYVTAARLSALTHAHLMALATINGLVALGFALSRRSSAFVCAVIATAFVGLVADLAAWWLIKYAGPGYELVSMVSGAMFTVAFLVMSVSLLRDTWFRKGAA